MRIVNNSTRVLLLEDRMYYGTVRIQHSRDDVEKYFNNSVYTLNYMPVTPNVT